MKDHPHGRQDGRKTSGRPTTVATPGVISVHEIYTLDEARRRLRWTESSMRAARREGLRPFSCGKRKYLSGKELLRFFESLGAAGSTPEPASIGEDIP